MRASDVLFPGGKYPAVALAHNHIIRAAYVAGHIHLKVHQIGDPYMRRVSEHVFCDTSGQSVEVEEQPFAVWGEGTTDGWHLLVQVAGEPGISEWVSNNHGQTWERATRQVLDRMEAAWRAR
jgi:hypothetical protein